jgi:hypothetical protein
MVPFWCSRCSGTWSRARLIPLQTDRVANESLELGNADGACTRNVAYFGVPGYLYLTAWLEPGGSQGTIGARRAVQGGQDGCEMRLYGVVEQASHFEVAGRHRDGRSRQAALRPDLRGRHLAKPADERVNGSLLDGRHHAGRIAMA